MLFKGSNILVEIYRSFAITGNYRAFLNMVFLTTMFTTADVNIHASNPQIWYRHPNKENIKVRPEMTKFKMSRESKHSFLFCGNYILKYW